MTPDEMLIWTLAATVVLMTAVTALGVATWRALGRLSSLPPVVPRDREADR